MQLKGSIEIHRIDSRTGQVQEVIKQDNIIPQATLVSLLSWNSVNNFFGSKFISISTQNTTPDVNNNSLTQIIATGYVATGTMSPEWYEGITPPFGQVRNRFDPPPGGIARTFNTVALANQASNNNQNSVTGIAFAYVKLDLSCTQGSFDTLDIYYRIQFQNISNKGFVDNDSVTKDFGRWLFGSSVIFPSFRMSYLYVHPSNVAVANYKNIYALAGASAAFFFTSFVNWFSGTAISSHFKWQYVYQQARSSTVGLGIIFSSMLQGQGETLADSAYNISKFNYPQEPFQTGFWHGSASTTPFFDANNFGSSNGRVTLSGTWTGGWPMLFKINVFVNLTVVTTSAAAAGVTSLTVQTLQNAIASGTQISFPNGVIATTTALAAAGGTSIPVQALSGAITTNSIGSYASNSGNGGVGTATYNWSVRRHLGFSGSNYTDLALGGNPYRHPLNQPAPGFHGWKDENNDLLRFSNTQIVQYDQTGVTLLDLMSGAYTNYDNTTIPAIGAGASSDIRQCATDGSRVYVACRNTGLWVIDVAAGTATNPVATPCYGVDIGRAGVAWAIFNGSLRNSNNWAASVTFTFTGLTDNNWARTRFLKADPGQTDDQLAIVADNGAGVNRVIWYRSSTAVATLGHSAATLKSWPASLDVSDTGGFWAIQSLRLTFAAATTSAIAAVPSQSLTSSIYGTDTFYKISFVGTSLIAASALISAANAVINSHTAIPASPYVLHMVGGIIIAARYMRQLHTDNVFCWENYGWDGSSWVLGLRTARPTHTAPQPLLHGISVAFANGANPPHFTATDYYTQGICFGLWKDNATDIFYQSQWYSKPVEFGFPIPSGVTIPPAGQTYKLTAANDVNYQRIETDSIDVLARFLIAGSPVATVYVNGEPPGPNEITVNGVTGVVTFNSVDAGKSFSGTYAWIRFA
jgi:hypothetical protein